MSSFRRRLLMQCMRQGNVPVLDIPSINLPNASSNTTIFVGDVSAIKPNTQYKISFEYKVDILSVDGNPVFALFSYGAFNYIQEYTQKNSINTYTGSVEWYATSKLSGIGVKIALRGTYTANITVTNLKIEVV